MRAAPAAHPRVCVRLAPAARRRDTQLSELRTALELHETGRDNLKKRVRDLETLLEQSRIAGKDRLAAVEELRTREMAQ